MPISKKRMREVFGDVELGAALPHNVGASRAVPIEIIAEMERVVLSTPSTRQLLNQFIRENHMDGPDNVEVQIRLDVRAELVVIANTEQGTIEVLPEPEKPKKLLAAAGAK